MKLDGVRPTCGFCEEVSVTHRAGRNLGELERALSCSVAYKYNHIKTDHKFTATSIIVLDQPHDGELVICEMWITNLKFARTVIQIQLSFTNLQELPQITWPGSMTLRTSCRITVQFPVELSLRILCGGLARSQTQLTAPQVKGTFALFSFHSCLCCLGSYVRYCRCRSLVLQWCMPPNYLNEDFKSYIPVYSGFPGRLNLSNEDWPDKLDNVSSTLWRT